MVTYLIVLATHAMKLSIKKLAYQELGEKIQEKGW